MMPIRKTSMSECARRNGKWNDFIDRAYLSETCDNKMKLMKIVVTVEMKLICQFIKKNCLVDFDITFAGFEFQMRKKKVPIEFNAIFTRN